MSPRRGIFSLSCGGHRPASGAAFGAALLLTWLAPPRSEALPQPRAHLIYARQPGAERCPDEEAVRSAVSSRLGYNPFSLDAPRTVTVIVRGEPQGLRAKLELADELGDVSGRRELTSPHADCVELAAALGFAVLLAIDPLHIGAPSAPPLEPEPIAPNTDTFIPPPVEPPTLRPPASPGPPPPSAPTERTRFFGGALVLLALGNTPSIAAPAFALQFGFRQRRWSAGVEVRGDVPGGLSTGQGRVSTALVAGLVFACVHAQVFPLGARRAEVSGCVLFGAGVQPAFGDGFDRDLREFLPWIAGGLRAALELPLANVFSLGVQADLLLPTTRTVVQVDLGAEMQEVWRTPAAQGAFALLFRGYFR